MENVIRYTPKDGDQDEFGLVLRWVKEPLEHSILKPDRRAKIKLIGEIIADAVNENITAGQLSAAMHKGLAEGRLKASGRFSVTKSEEAAYSERVDFRAVIPQDVFLPFSPRDGHEHHTVVFNYDDGGQDNEWIRFNWLDSSVEYWAHGEDINEYMTLNRWECRWSNIMVPQDQAAKIMAEVSPRLRRYTKPKNRLELDENEIRAKLDAMHQSGMNAEDIYREIRHEPGFENVGTLKAKELGTGRWKSGPNSR